MVSIFGMVDSVFMILYCPVLAGQYWSIPYTYSEIFILFEWFGC